MSKIDTKRLRTGTTWYTLSEARVDLAAVADELDRLYHDTTPLTREDLESVLKEEGYIRVGILWENKDWLLKFTDTGNLYANHDTIRCQLDIPLSAITRQLLKACGVIQ